MMNNTNKINSKLEVFEESFRSLPHMAFILNEDLNIFDVSNRLLDNYKINRADILNQHFSEYFDSYNLISGISKFATSKNTELDLIHNLLIDRTLTSFKFKLKKVGETQKNILVILENNSEYQTLTKEYEALISKTDALSRMAFLGDMSKVIAQEMDTPLTVILNNIKQLKRLINISDLEINKKIESIQQSTQKLIRLSTNIKLFSKEKNSDVLKSVFVKDLITSSLELCSDNLKNNQINLYIDEIDKNLLIDCKKNQFSQIVINLINHSKANLIDNEEKWIKVSAIDNGDYVKFQITNPISESTYVNKNIKDSIQSEIGNNLSKEIIEDHFGKYSVEIINNNKVFSFEIPKGLSQTHLS